MSDNIGINPWAQTGHSLVAMNSQSTPRDDCQQWPRNSAPEAQNTSKVRHVSLNERQRPSPLRSTCDCPPGIERAFGMWLRGWHGDRQRVDSGARRCCHGSAHCPTMPVTGVHSSLYRVVRNLGRPAIATPPKTQQGRWSHIAVGHESSHTARYVYKLSLVAKGYACQARSSDQRGQAFCTLRTYQCQ